MSMLHFVGMCGDEQLALQDPQAEPRPSCWLTHLHDASNTGVICDVISVCAVRR